MRGQALAEGVVALGALAALFWAIPVLGRYLDISLSSTQASRLAAFRAIQDEASAAQAGGAPHFLDRARASWRDDRGAALVTQAPAVSLRRVAALRAFQPGAGLAEVSELYADWRLEDQGILVATVGVPARDVVSGGLRPARRLAFQGHTAILAQAGHAADDADVGRRIAAGGAGWGKAHASSVSAGRPLASSLNGIDQGWGRAAPEFDWLSAWEALAPEDRLVSRDVP